MEAFVVEIEIESAEVVRDDVAGGIGALDG
jgi:hypothetical protein